MVEDGLVVLRPVANREADKALPGVDDSEHVECRESSMIVPSIVLCEALDPNDAAVHHFYSTVEAADGLKASAKSLPFVVTGRQVDALSTKVTRTSVTSFAHFTA